MQDLAGECGAVVIAYVLSLCFAAAFTGSFVRGVFAQFGYIPGLMPAVYVTLGTALLYAGTQLLYLGLLRIYQPTRSRALYFTEACSSLAAVLLLPALLNIPIPGMTGRMERLVPLAYFGLFVAVHCFFKLASFYAALTGTEDHQRTIYRWVLSGLGSLIVGALLIFGWRGSVDEARVTVTGNPTRVQAGSQYGLARVAPEGATISGAIAAGESPTLALRFAPMTNAEENRPVVSRVYVTVTLQGRDTKTYQDSTALRPDGWAEITVPPEFIPRDVNEYSLYWTRVREPDWQRILGIRPIVYNLPEAPGEKAPLPAQVYLSGPSVYQARPAAKSPNLLVVLVDGLGADHVSLFGYPREVTPAIDRVGYRAQLFPSTIARGATVDAALFAMMTGEDPAQLGNTASGPALPELLRRAGYATVAFIESSDTEFMREAPWASGFEIFDTVRPGADEKNPSPGALARAQAWISEHQFIPFLCVVRVRTLAAFPPATDDSDITFESEGGTLDIDRFDNALVAVDRQLGALFKFIRDYETRSNTCIIVTAPYGHEFSPGASRKFTGVPSERVPLIIEIPDRRQRKIPKEAHLHDLGATLAYLGGVRLPGTADGVNLVP